MSERWDEPSKRGEQSVHGKPNVAESNANVGLWVMSMSFLKALIKIAILQNRLIREIRSLFIKLTRLGLPVSLAILAATFLEKPFGAFNPLPTAAPSIASS